MNVNDLTIEQAKELISSLGFTDKKKGTLNRHIGQKVIIRTYSAGVWFGTLTEKEGNEVILDNARRMWRFWCIESISLSGVALYGIIHEKSKIIAPVKSAWLEAIEILELTEKAIDSIEGAPYVEAE